MPTLNTSHKHGPHHHHHHHNKFPPRDYTDLSKTDIALLAPIFAPLPTPETSAAATYRLRTKKLITELPFHLQAKIPKLSTFCSMHHHLNPMPVIDLVRVVQREVAPEALQTWTDTKELPLTMLRDVNSIWTKPTYSNTSQSTCFVYQSNKCAACHLAVLARSPDALIALGAITIARLNPKNWKKSKRILWFEEWLTQCVEWRQDDKTSVEIMWKAGVQLSQGMEAKKDGDGDERPWVDEYVAMATAPPSPSSTRFEDAEATAVRPPRSPAQADHIAFVTEALQEVQDPFDEPAPNSPVTTVHNPFDDPDNETVMDELFPQQIYEQASAIHEPLRPRSRPLASSIYSTDETAHLLRTPATTRVASSVYSEHDEGETFWQSARFSETSENEVIEAYRANETRRRGLGGFL